MPEGKDGGWYLLQELPKGSRCVSVGVPGDRKRSPESDIRRRISLPKRKSASSLHESDAEAEVGSVNRGSGSR